MLEKSRPLSQRFMAVQGASVWPNISTSNLRALDGNYIQRTAMENVANILGRYNNIFQGYGNAQERLTEVLRRLRKAGLKVKPSKCSLFAKEVEYLGHVVSNQGVATDPKKVEAIREWPIPMHPRDLRAFLGTCSYYRRYVPGYAEISRPLTQQTGKYSSSNLKWTAECQKAFEEMKNILMTAPILSYPDFEVPFILDTDASDVGTGAVLSQLKDNLERVIAYYSKAMTQEEQNYCTTRQELLAIIKAVKHF